MFKTIIYNSDYRQSIYRIDSQRKDINYYDLLDYIVKAAGSNLAVITDAEKETYNNIIKVENEKNKPNKNQEEYNDIIHTLEAVLPTYQECLNPKMIEGFKKYIARAGDLNGAVIYLARTSLTAKTWRQIDDVLNYITTNKLDNIFIQELLAMEYFKTRAPKEGGPTMFQIINPIDGSWAEPITKAQLYWTAYELNKTKLSLDRQSVINALNYMNNLEQNIPPFIDVFNNTITGWLYKKWNTSILSTIEMPKILTNDPTVDAFSYVDLNLEQNIPTPAFDGFLEQMESCWREPFCAALYAVCFEQCKRIPQVVYLHGEGNDGKSSLFNALNNYFGSNLVSTIDSKIVTDDFGAESLIGHRLLVLGDCQNGNILNSNLVHQITGGDLVSINRKNEKRISYRFNSIIMIAANLPPSINMNNRNEARRILYIKLNEPSYDVMKKYCQVDEKTKTILRYKNNMPKYKSYDLEADLINEMTGILFKCKQCFEKICPPPYKTLEIPEACYDLMSDECTSYDLDYIELFIKDKIIIKTNEVTEALLIYQEYLKFVYGDKNSNVNKHLFDIQKLKRYLKTNYNLEAKRLTKNKNKITVYDGICIKTEDYSTYKQADKTACTDSDNSFTVGDLV